MEIVKMFVSKDRQIFETADECAAHDGLVKCLKCNGSGQERYEHRIPYPSGLPDSGWVDDTIEIKLIPCSRCNATGYTEYNIESDPEYMEFKRLQAKFGDK